MTNEPIKDPLGVQPAPIKGDARPVFTDPERNARVETVLPFFKTNYIEYEPQTDLVEQILSYFKSTQSILGGPIDGLRLSEHGSAGKSRMLEHLVHTAALRRAEAGLPPNPHEIICIELDKTISVAAFFRRILKELGDDHWNDKRVTIDDLEDRILAMARRLGVQGLVGDEIQHLDRKTTDATQVTSRLKTFLNRGILPLILVGDETSEKFFQQDGHFSIRLGSPLKLKPLEFSGPNGPHDRKLFLDFCDKLDKSMVDNKIVDELAGFSRRIMPFAEVRPPSNATILASPRAGLR